MKKSVLLVLGFSFCMIILSNAQHEYIGISSYKADIKYIEKMEPSPESEAILERLKMIASKSTIELDVMGDENKELEKLQRDIRDFIKPRKATYHHVEIEREVVKYLLSLGDILYVDCVNIIHDDWQLSPRGTYKYFEFDAVGKNALNFYVLLNGYYKLELTNKSRHKDAGGRNIPYVYIDYKRAITYNNYFHRLIRK